MRKTILLQSLDSTRFESTHEKQNEFNLMRARTDVVSALLYGYQIALPQAYLLGSTATLQLLDELIPDIKSEKEACFFPFVPAYPRLYVGPQEIKTMSEFATSYWSGGGKASSLFKHVNIDDRDEVSKKIIECFRVNSFEEIAPHLGINESENSFSRQLEKIKKYSNMAGSKGIKIYENDNKEYRKANEKSHLDAVKSLLLKLSLDPEFRESENFLLFSKGVCEIEKMIGNAESKMFSRALFFKICPDIFGDELWPAIKITLESNYTKNVQHNYMIHNSLKSTEPIQKAKIKNLLVPAFSEDNKIIAYKGEMPKFHSNFNMEIIGELYQDKDFLASINKLHECLLHNKNADDTKRHQSEHTMLLSKKINDLNFDLHKGIYIVTPKYDLSIAAKSAAGAVTKSTALAATFITSILFTEKPIAAGACAAVAIVGTFAETYFKERITPPIKSTLQTVASLFDGNKNSMYENNNRALEQINNKIIYGEHSGQDLYESELIHDII